MFSPVSQDPAWHLSASGLPSRWQRTDSFVVLDTAFAFDRFAATCAAFEASPGDCGRLHYLTVCPLGTPTPVLPPGCHAVWIHVHRELSERWPLPLPGLHQISLLEGRVQLSVAFGEAGAQVRLLDAVCDALFLDGRVPVPASALARLSRTGATFALQSASQPQTEALANAGFEISPTPMGVASSGAFRARKRNVTPANAGGRATGGRAALIIGAGLAGTAVASALAARGWEVSLLEREPMPAAGASGNLAAVFSPLLSLDDGRASRLSRACFLRLLAELRSLERAALPLLWQACGVFQMPRSDKEESHFRELVLKHAYPERYVRFIEKDAAQERFGQVLPSGGWFFEEGGWVNPPSLCDARLAAHPKIKSHFGQDVRALEHHLGRWTALGPAGEKLASAPVLVLANAWEATHLLPQAVLPFKRVRGQVAHLPPDSVPQIRPVLSKDGYLTPLVNGLHCLGATYDFGSDEPSLNPDAHSRNLERLTQLLPGASLPLTAPPLGRVGFRTLTPDRMPIAGALPPPFPAHPPSLSSEGQEHPGLYCLLGLGSRGLVWSSLLGEYLAALIAGTPSPLPLDLAAHLSPGRFIAHKPKQEDGDKYTGTLGIQAKD